MKPQSKTDKIKQVLMTDSLTPAAKIAKRFKVAPSYVYNIRKQLRGELLNEVDALIDATKDTLVLTAKGEDTITLSQDQGQWVATVKDLPRVETALNTQVGGDHYKNFKIQPVEFIHANNLPFIEGNIVKYIVRWREKNGLKDLEKVKHYVDLLIELEQLKKNL